MWCEKLLQQADAFDRLVILSSGSERSLPSSSAQQIAQLKAGEKSSSDRLLEQKVQELFQLHFPAYKLMHVISKFEAIDYVHVFRSVSEDLMRVELPRYGILMELSAHGISMVDYRGYYLRASQTLTDTLYGLSSYLVLELRDEDDAEGRAHTKIIVPDGQVVRENDQQGVLVKVASACNAKLQHHAYDVHTRFDHLQARNTAGRLHLAALYAATSTLVAEERTKMTGTEHATELVRQCWKNSPMSRDEARHLHCVVRHAYTSPTLALVCSDLERSASEFAFLYPDEHVSHEKMHFVHLGMTACRRYTSDAGCDAIKDYATAYQTHTQGVWSHYRKALTVEEELGLLGFATYPRAVAWPACDVPTMLQRIGAGEDLTSACTASPRQKLLLAQEIESILRRVAEGGAQVGEGSEDVDMDVDVCDNKVVRSLLHQIEQMIKSSQKCRSRGPRSEYESSSAALTSFPLESLSNHAGLGTKLSRHMLEELKESWEAHKRCEARRKPFPWLHDMRKLADILGELRSVVAHTRQDAEDIVFALMLVGAQHQQTDTAHAADVGLRLIQMMRACNLAPTPSSRDLLRMMVTPSLVMRFNPLLTEDGCRHATEWMTAWAALCVLEDKLRRLCAWTKASADEEQSQWIQSAVNELKVGREWRVQDHPEWLALEVEGGLQIRPKQYRIARKLIDGNSSGSIVQLNMGEGKTRVVLPMVWLHQSRGRKFLVRANLLSQLLPEGREHLEQYYSASVLSRRLYALPFHRDVNLTSHDIRRMHASLAQCQRTGGLLMVAPEHRNSLQLKAVEWHLSPDKAAKKLLRGLDAMFAGYPFFDIHDESDLILDHLYLLVYSWGAPCALPGQFQFLVVTSPCVKCIFLCFLVMYESMYVCVCVGGFMRSCILCMPCVWAFRNLHAATRHTYHLYVHV
jgi:hypothetical protein